MNLIKSTMNLIKNFNQECEKVSNYLKQGLLGAYEVKELLLKLF